MNNLYGCGQILNLKFKIKDQIDFNYWWHDRELEPCDIDLIYFEHSSKSELILTPPRFGHELPTCAWSINNWTEYPKLLTISSCLRVQLRYVSLYHTVLNDLISQKRLIVTNRFYSF